MNTDQVVQCTNTCIPRYLQAATERAATAAQQAEEVKRANSPFGGWPFNGPARSGGSAGGGGMRAPSPYQQQNNGPVVDAEFYTIDEGDE